MMHNMCWCLVTFRRHSPRKPAYSEMMLDHKTRKTIPALSKACMAVFWPTSLSEWSRFVSSVFSVEGILSTTSTVPHYGK